jgi:hypothetical protein
VREGCGTPPPASIVWRARSEGGRVAAVESVACGSLVDKDKSRCPTCGGDPRTGRGAHVPKGLAGRVSIGSKPTEIVVAGWTDPLVMLCAFGALCSCAATVWLLYVLGISGLAEGLPGLMIVVLATAGPAVAVLATRGIRRSRRRGGRLAAVSAALLVVGQGVHYASHPQYLALGTVVAVATLTTAGVLGLRADRAHAARR